MRAVLGHARDSGGSGHVAVVRAGTVLVTGGWRTKEALHPHPAVWGESFRVLVRIQSDPRSQSVRVSLVHHRDAPRDVAPLSKTYFILAQGAGVTERAGKAAGGQRGVDCGAGAPGASTTCASDVRVAAAAADMTGRACVDR